jgi:hypothetical protein
VSGACTNYFTSPSCTTCPCAACGSGATCCAYPGPNSTACVSGTTCP